MKKKDEVQGCVYILTNKINGKKYVGQHSSIKAEHRWCQHVCDAFAGSEAAIHCAIRKYGAENFLAEVLERSPVGQLDAGEAFWIAQLNTYIDGGLGYNMTYGGRGMRGWVTSEFTRNKISIGVTLSYELQPELRLNRVASQLGRKHTEAECIANGERIKAAHIADPTYRIRLSLAHTGKKNSEETRRKISEGHARRRLQKEKAG